MTYVQPGKWYHQGFSDQDLYFFGQSVQKNGGVAGIHFTVEKFHPRKTPKPKKGSVNKAWFSLWKEVPASSVPEKVLGGVASVTQRDPATTISRGSISHFLMVLSSKLTQWDMKQMNSRFANPYALGHLLGALHRVEDHIKRDFHPGVLATGEVGAQLARTIASEFDPNFPPVKNVLKQLHTFVTTGKTPKLTGR